MILGARRLGLGQGGRRAAHVEATNDRGGKGAGGERQRRDGRTSARGAPARRTDVGRGHRQGDTDGGTSERGTPGRRGRCPCGGRRRAARLRGDRRGRGTPAEGRRRQGRHGGAGPRGAIGRGPYRGAVRPREDGRRRKDARAGVVFVAQVHAGMEAGTGGADQGEFAWGTPVRGAGPKLP